MTKPCCRLGPGNLPLFVLRDVSSLCCCRKRFGPAILLPILHFILNLEHAWSCVDSAAAAGSTWSDVHSLLPLILSSLPSAARGSDDDQRMPRGSLQGSASAERLFAPMRQRARWPGSLPDNSSLLSSSFSFASCRARLLGRCLRVEDDALTPSIIVS